MSHVYICYTVYNLTITLNYDLFCRSLVLMLFILVMDFYQREVILQKLL